MPDYLHNPGLAMPTPLHTLTPAAEAARQAVRDFAVRRQAERDAPPELVTHHVPPWVEVQLHNLTGSAALFAKAALAAGHEVMAFEAGDAVEVRVNRGAIRAWWVGGRTTDALCSTVFPRAVSITVATYALTMPLADALARYQRESDERKARAAERKAEKLAAEAAL